MKTSRIGFEKVKSAWNLSEKSLSKSVGTGLLVSGIIVGVLVVVAVVVYEVVGCSR